jgi:anthranilate phosphoribosyltransferase
MKEILSYLFEHKALTKSDARDVLTNIASGKYNDPEIAAFVSVYLMRNITVEELAGFRDALLDLCIPLDLTDFNTIDVCGTGGDGKNTFNISTLTSFVVAGAGEKVSKHGNYSVSSSCGSSNVMEYYGYKFSADSDKLRREMDQTGICFLHAPLFNPAMKNVAPVRRSLRMKTFFNMLGPMVNPSSPRNQLVGVFSLDVARLYNYIYQDTDIRFTIIHSLDGYDEISLSSPFKIYKDAGEQIHKPEEIGFNRLMPQEIYGGENVEEVSKIFMDILMGQGTKAQNSVVVANAAFALQTIDPSLELHTAVGKASDALLSGKGYQVFRKLMDMQ